MPRLPLDIIHYNVYKSIGTFRNAQRRLHFNESAARVYNKMVINRLRARVSFRSVVSVRVCVEFFMRIKNKQKKLREKKILRTVNRRE